MPEAPSPPPCATSKGGNTRNTTAKGENIKPATTVPPELAPSQRVILKEIVAMNQGRANRKPAQTRTHVILYDTDARSPLKHPYYGSTCNIPLVHRYNTRARRIKVHNLKDNHMETVHPQIPPDLAFPTYSLQK